ncbi:2-deoxyribose-5-phosphate aldolase [Pseudomonas sp. Leaf127]|uniref:deoxyribose-phosphate aldolase n=1 Tax=Pseudomonas sp. Leaf127 TaxID=1736267 RepID=UPI000702F849|nr:deoxyribose-phosphate aldolase [Pseudomonas sp. Leaf127]KQQ50073.1 2-deoxyribose-5-phosphate aldolase [Pseudomonas sp. Leaf127]
MNVDNEAQARQAISLLELLAFNQEDTEQRIVSLCRSALTPVGPVAGVCVYPHFVCLARTTLDRLQAQDVRVIGLVNFPAGRPDVELAAQQARAVLLAGADEVEVVYPFRALLAGDVQVGANLVAACKAECGSRASLTVTLETGDLRDPQLIRSASRAAIASGADFLKTCTGRLVAPATAQAARIMLESIAEIGGQVGLKVAGGLRTVADAQAFLTLARGRFGPNWLTPQRFRLGASSLLGDALARLGLLGFDEF